MALKGDPKVIKHLNAALKAELTAINQYFVHSRLLDSWGLTKMARHEYKESIEEMQHADKIIQRIILLGGLPNLQTLDKLHIGENAKEVIEGDLKLELIAIPMYKAAIKDCEAANDYVSRDLFAAILADEEGHADHLQTQLDMIGSMGLQNYLLLQAEAQASSVEA